MVSSHAVLLTWQCALLILSSAESRYGVVTPIDMNIKGHKLSRGITDIMLKVWYQIKDTSREQGRSKSEVILNHS